MKITALLENTAARKDLGTEHGLSLYIEAAGHRILFDMGQSDLFYENARTLGIDLSAVDLAVLSHGHYDHGCGLRRFLEINETAPVYVHRDAFLPHYHGKEKYIGLDPVLYAHPRLLFTEGTLCIDGALTLSDCNARTRRHPLDSAGLCEYREGVLLPDEFRHEQYLLIEEAGRRVLISGCSHKGIRDVCAWFSPDVLVGGFHYSKHPTDGALEAAARELAAFPTHFYTCHCTGVAQYEFMKQYLPRLDYLACGESITV